MVFSSLTFIAFFLPITLLLYFISKNKTWRNVVLLVLSLIFYAWGEPRFVFLMIISIAVNYAAGLFIDKYKKARMKRYARISLIIALAISLGFLFWFKYSSFLANTILSIFGSSSQVAAKVLPIGISFYTFQIITYTVDVYKGRVPVQRDIVKLALYISFFPQLIAGPIVNYTYIEPYLDHRKITPAQFFNGLSRFFVGLGKKILIANLCGEVLNTLTHRGFKLSFGVAWGNMLHASDIL